MMVRRDQCGDQVIQHTACGVPSTPSGSSLVAIACRVGEAASVWPARTGVLAAAMDAIDRIVDVTDCKPKRILLTAT